MEPITSRRISAWMGATGVALGAFGAHGLKTILATNNSTQTWQTAAHYHLIHAVVLLVLSGKPPFSSGAFSLILSGTILFSGSLYILATTQIHWLGAITPIGGVCLILGWITLLRK